MLSIKRAIARFGSVIERPVDKIRYIIKKRLNWLGPIQIFPYRGYGTSEKFYLKGRVLEDKGITRATENHSVWQNIVEMYKRFESDEIPGVRLLARFGNTKQEVVTDNEGYFEINLNVNDEFDNGVWHEIELKLLDKVFEGQECVFATGEVLIPSSESSFGIISDIDDTVVKTDVTSVLKMLRLTFFNNARTRLPFKGVAAFYRALRQGAQESSDNPIFYVSSSPWNLYDLLIDFMDVHGIPEGPLFLRDFGVDSGKLFATSHKDHKLKQIEKIINTYPKLPFILIGDSGQKDPEIYKQVVDDFPGRILAIYIRNVTPGVRDSEVMTIGKGLSDFGIEMLLVKDTVEAARHAVKSGFISSKFLPSIRGEKEKDENAPGDLEQFLRQ